MLMVFETLGLFDPSDTEELLTDRDILSRKITNFSRSVKR